MELRDYFKIIGRRIWLLAAIVIVATLATYIFMIKKPSVYDASLSIVVSKKQQANTTDYQYDQYYAIQASSLYADEIANLFKDPTNIIKIYTNADLNLPTNKTKSLPKFIVAKRIPPVTIILSLTDKDKNNANKLIVRSSSFVKDITDKWASQGINQEFSLTFNDPIVVLANRNVSTNTILGLIAGFILGLGAIFFVEYMYANKK